MVMMAVLGLPRLAPPVGALRWRAPQPPEPWTGVRRAVAYGADPTQQPFAEDLAPLRTTPSEDCLFLNLWRPAGNRHNAYSPKGCLVLSMFLKPNKFFDQKAEKIGWDTPGGT